MWDRYYIKATAKLVNSEWLEILSTWYAREEENKKWMDGSQITWSSSSYARKYALNWLFAIDDNKDSDFTNKHEDKVQKTYNNNEQTKWFNIKTDDDLEKIRMKILEWWITNQDFIDKLKQEWYAISRANKEKILNLF